MNILTSFRRRFIINGNWINLQIIHLGFHYSTGSSTMPAFILTSAGNFPQIQFPSTGGTKLQQHRYSEEANHACSVECLSKASVLLSVFGKKACGQDQSCGISWEHVPGRRERAWGRGQISSLVLPQLPPLFPSEGH